MGPEWALKQVREPFCWAWLCGSRRGALGSSGCSCGCCSSCWGCSLGPLTAQLGSTPQCCFSLPFVTSSTNPEKTLLRGTGKRLPMAERGWLCQADPKTCTHPPSSPRKEGKSATAGPGSLLKPHPHHNKGGTELNSARNSTPFLSNDLPQKYLSSKKSLFPAEHN